MADIDGFGELYAQICREWNKAEEDVKRAEQVCEEVIIPSIMELRYAGRRLAQALELMSQGGKPREVEKLLHDASFNCHRARHDAIDASTAQIAKTLTIAVDKLHYSAILQAFPAFPALRAHLQKLRDKIVATRGAATTRDRIYETVESSDFPALLALFADFQASESIMISLAARDRRIFIITLVALGIAVLALFGEGFHLVMGWLHGAF